MTTTFDSYSYLTLLNQDKIVKNALFSLSHACLGPGNTFSEASGILASDVTVAWSDAFFTNRTVHHAILAQIVMVSRHVRIVEMPI